MKKALLLGALAFVSATLATAQTWQLGPTVPFGYLRFDGEYYPPNGLVYFLGARVGTNTTSGRIWSFDPITGTFKNESLDIQTAVSNYNVCLLKDRTGPDSLALYLVGGRDASGGYSSALQVFYPLARQATSITTDPWIGRIGTKVTMPSQGQVVFNNKLYVFGGMNLNAPTPYATDSTFVYDPAQSPGSRWSRIPTAILSLARGYITPAVVDGKIYAIGGSYSTSGTTLINTRNFERFDPANPSAGWVRLVDLPDTCSEAQAFGFDTGSPYGLGGHIIVAPRGCWPNPFAVCWDYTVATNAWTTFASVNTARRAHAAFFVPGTRGTGGIPGMWILGGRGTVDTPGLNSSEYYQLTASAVEEQGGVRLVKRTALEAAAPNPFSGQTILRYSLAESGPVGLVIYGITGQKVRSLVSGERPAGTHEAVWDGKDDFGKPVGAGIYFTRFAAENVRTTQRVTVLR